MRRLLSITVLLLTLSGCAIYSTPVPDNYNGPIAVVKDSINVYSSSKVDFFYMDKFEGKRIENSRSKTIEVNDGRGMHMQPVVLERFIPVKEAVVKIVGRTVYAAPILSFTNTVYEVSGDVIFKPEQDKTYVVKGILGEDYSAVWIEEKITSKVVSNKIEMNGSAALSFFEK